jgi:hypothetical protein
MNIYEAFKTNKKEEEEGKWIEYPGQKTKVAIASTRNTLYKKALTDALKKINKASFDNLSDEEERKLWYEIYAESVVKDNKVLIDNEYKQGILLEDKNGKLELKEFNKGNLIKLFTALPQLFDDIREVSGNWTNFRCEVEEEKLKK